LGEVAMDSLKEYPDWTCDDCAKKYGDKWPEGHLATYRVGTCDVCGKKKFVTQPRDWGHKQLSQEITKVGLWLAGSMLPGWWRRQYWAWILWQGMGRNLLRLNKIVRWLEEVSTATHRCPYCGFWCKRHISLPAFQCLLNKRHVEPR